MYCLLCSHSFQTKPNSVTNCFQLFSLLQLYKLHCSCVAFKDNDKEKDKENDNDTEKTSESENGEGNDSDDSDDSDGVVMGLVPVGIEKSHEGISLSTLSVIGMSRSDQQRLFTIMLRESDSETIRGNGAR